MFYKSWPLHSFATVLLLVAKKITKLLTQQNTKSQLNLRRANLTFAIPGEVCIFFLVLLVTNCEVCDLTFSTLDKIIEINLRDC